jgi:hypothetical protein
MAGIGRFKLTDALPPERQFTDSTGTGPGGQPVPGKAKKVKLKRKGAKTGEQLREARESSQARNAEASSRDRMVDIGRGNQQAGRQRSGSK